MFVSGIGGAGWARRRRIEPIEAQLHVGVADIEREQHDS
jgi:hypothetical protein